MNKTHPEKKRPHTRTRRSERRSAQNKKTAGRKRSAAKSRTAKKKREELFRGRLIPALVVLIPLILASVTVLAVYDAERSSPKHLTLQPDETGEDGTADSAGEEDGGSGVEGRGDVGAGQGEGADNGEPADGGEIDTEESSEPQETRATLYIVVDDVGYHTDNLRRFLQLPIPITFAVLPKLPDTSVAVELIESADGEYILHQPMEPIGKEDPGPGALTTKMSDKEVREVLSENLKDLPNARGINNHMGSKLTSDPNLMDEVLTLIGEKKLFFLDSRTTSKTVAKQYAEEHRVAFTERHVFLDNESSEAYILDALEEGTRIADNRGYAVLIGHVWSRELYEVLEERHDDLQEKGYSFGYITNLFRGETVHAGARN